jgi:hypothetical protein
MDYDQRLPAQNDKRNEEKTMSVDENVFFREATLRICSSLDIQTALKRWFEYIGAFIPTIGMTLHTLDHDLKWRKERTLLKFRAEKDTPPVQFSGD